MLTGDRRNARQAISCLLLLLIQPINLYAQTNWNATTDSWFESQNWTAGVPQAAVDAVVNNGGLSQVLAASGTARNVTIGDSASGALEISNGGTISGREGRIGNIVGAQGTVTVNGLNSKWTNSSILDIGVFGTGTLNITSGGQVSNTASTIGRFAGSMGTVTVTGANSKWTHSDFLDVGVSGKATLNIQNGALVDVVQTTEIGSLGQINFDNGNLKTRNLQGNLDQLSGVGSINTNGLRTNLNLVFDSQHGPQQQIMVGNVAINLDANGQGDFSTGHEGLGSLTIADGVTVPCRTGIVDSGNETNVTAVVTGIGSTWRYNSFMTVGASETGTLLIQNGGQVLGNSQGGSFSHVGRNGNGTVTITGNGSRWTAQTFTLAESSDGTGEITIENGGELLLNIGFGGGTIGGRGHGKATVSGQGSKWINSRSGPWNDSGTLIISDGGTGELIITNGGLVSNSFGEIAANTSRSTGTVTVTGSGSTWTNSHDLYVARNRFLTGRDYNGTLLIEAGGTVTSANGFIGLNTNANGTVEVTGNSSSWTSSGQISIGDGGRGLLRVSDGAVVSAANGIGIKGGGTITGDGTIVANIVNSGGIVAPGASIGTLKVSGSYAQDAIGTMEFEIAGSAAGEYDVLNVSGPANLAGELHVSLVDTIPAVGEVLTVFTSDSLINNGITLRGAYVGLFELDVNNSSVAIRVANAGSPGDFNLDGIVDAADYVVWRENSGTQQEYDSWRANFGFATVTGIAVATTVPEPAIWAPLFTAAICCLVMRLPRRILYV